MWTTAVYAFRNLWRNPRRTVITASALSLGLAALVFITGWAKGINLHMVTSATRSGIGHGQIHHTGYRVTGDPEIYMADYRSTLAAAEKAHGVAGASPRVLGEGLLAMGGRSSSVRLIGVDPERERRVSNWAEKLAAGSFLGASSTVVIGRSLAGNLEVEVGSKLVLTVADIKSGELNYRLVTVAGIVSSENPLIEKMGAIVNLPELAADMGIGGGAHEIALFLDADPRDRASLVKILEPLKKEGLEVEEWQTVAPVIARIGEVQNFFLKIVVGIVFFLVSFGVVNTMSMALIERFREFGILRALGTSPLGLAGLMVMEAAWLGLVGCTAGLGLGLAVLAYYASAGIPLPGVQFMDVAIKTPVYPVLYWPWIAMVYVSFLVLTPVSSLLVAARAARIDPVKALRSE